MNPLWEGAPAKSMRRAVGRAVGDFAMISGGDRILTGLSGGKDSLVLLHTLAALKRCSPVNFTLAACTVSESGTAQDELAEYCRALEVELTVLPSSIIEIIKTRQERSPCSFCANMRRGMLSGFAGSHGFNKLALGHNLDDAVETFFMNLLRAGRAKSFQPVSLLTRTNVTVIRPLLYLRENAVRDEARRLGLPVTATSCPYAGTTERQRVKELLAVIKKDAPDIFSNTVNALKKLSSADSWAGPPAVKTKRDIKFKRDDKDES